VKIRTQFVTMVVGITLIPVLLLGVAWAFWTLNQNQDTIPLYEQLPRESEGLTDPATWNKIRDLLVHRPNHAQTLVFDNSFRLIFSTVPVPDLPPGRTVPTDGGLERLKRAGSSQDIVIFQLAGTKVWIVLIQDAKEAHPDPFQGPLLFLGIVLVGILIFTILFSIIMGRNLTRSIVVLERAVRRVAEGDLDSRVDEVRGSYEIEDLGRSFEQLRLSLKEESARKSRFVMGLSHDLKTPLALIKGYAELLQDGPPTDQQARKAHFGLILDKVDQLDGMIEDLIDYSKVNTGEWQDTWTEIPFRAFLEEYGPSAALDAKLLGRTLETAIDLPHGLKVPCDTRSIRRCLENILGNSLRYTKEGDRLGISAKLVAAGVELTLWDEGPGISQDDLPHIFELFYRGSHSRRESGMGIGLSVVKTIIDSHGWSIRAESGPGTRFIITIPT